MTHPYHDSSFLFSDDFRQAFNLTLEDDMISSLQIILQNGIERVELLELGNINDSTTESTILIANYGVAVIGRVLLTTTWSLDRVVRLGSQWNPGERHYRFNVGRFVITRFWF